MLLHIGTNTLGDGVAAVEAILDEIDRFSADIVVVLAKIINRNPYNAMTSTFNENLELMAIQREMNGDLLYLVDMESALDYSVDMFDEKHPKESGYLKMATEWYQVLVENVLATPQKYPPQFLASIQNQQLVIGYSYSFDCNAFGFPVPEYTLDGEPAGMVIDPATGVIEWTPDTVGSYSVTVTARNTEGADSQTFTINAVEAPSFPEGVVSYWRLDETAGSVYFDANMIADGQCAADCPQPAVGLVDGGQTFDGSSEINVAPDTLFDRGFGESFSVEFWMRKATDTGGNEPALARDDKSSKVHWWAGVGHTVERGKARFYVRDRAGNGFGVSGTTVLTDAAWHHVVAVQDGAAAELRIYVDGNLEGTTPTSYSSDFIAPTAKLTIGWMDIGLHFNGDLDEAAFYSRSLTQEEIGALYYNAVTGHGYFEENNYAPIITSAPPASIISNTFIHMMSQVSDFLSPSTPWTVNLPAWSLTRQRAS